MSGGRAQLLPSRRTSGDLGEAFTLIAGIPPAAGESEPLRLPAAVVGVALDNGAL
jgi:hypothetical protein